MRDRITTMRSRMLGRGLRVALARKNLNVTEAAKRLNWSPSKMSRLLSGKRGGSRDDVVRVLAITGAPQAEQERLLALCTEAARPGMFTQHGSRLPEQLIELADHESYARSFAEFQPIIVPGLLQTSEYAHALFTGIGTLPLDQVDGHVGARMTRKAIFGRRPPPTFDFFIHEFALRLVVGGNEIMSGQLHHMLELLVRPHISIRVVPASAGAHAGVAGPFMLMNFDEIDPVVYVETQTASIFLEEPDEIAAYRDILRALADTALDEGQSHELIVNLATQLNR